MLFLELVKSVPQRCYLARYLYFACNKPKTFIDVKKLPSSKGLSQLIIYLVKKRRNTATTVQSGVTAALTITNNQINVKTKIYTG